MTEAEKKQLLAQYPESPSWVLARTYDQALEAMKLRREAFPKTSPTEKVRLITGLNPFGAGIHATAHDLCWIESEQAYHGKTDEGEKYLIWDISKDGESRNYRRIK